MFMYGQMAMKLLDVIFYQGNRTDNARENLKICVLLENYFPSLGGVETHTKNIIKFLRSKGLNFLIVTRRYSRNLPKMEVIDDTPVFRIPPIGPNSLSEKWIMILPVLWFLFRRQSEYDIIYVPGFNAMGIPAVLAAKFFRKKVVFRAVNPGELSGEYSLAALRKNSPSPFTFLIKLILLLKRMLLLKADKFIATTGELEENFLTNKVNPEKILRIPNGIDTDLYRPASAEEKAALRKKLSIPLDKIIVLFVGRLVSWKGLPLLARAWEKVASDCPQAHLYLVGPRVTNMDGCEDELKRIITALGISNSVTFTGGVNNSYDFFRSADIFVSPAEYEAFGITVIEAMSCGLPVVVTSVGGMRETVKNKEQGFAIPSDDLGQLHKSLVSLIRDKSLRTNMGKAGRARAEINYAIEKSGLEYFNLFNSLFDVEKKLFKDLRENI